MKTFKFRAWHKEAEEMLYEKNPGDVFHWLFEGQPIEIMQFTGLKDDDEKEIYEGDIAEVCHEDSFHSDMLVRGYTTYDETDAIYRVDFPNFGCSKILLDYIEMGIKIVGNEYENPEMIEE